MEAEVKPSLAEQTMAALRAEDPTFQIVPDRHEEPENVEASNVDTGEEVEESNSTETAVAPSAPAKFELTDEDLEDLDKFIEKTGLSEDKAAKLLGFKDTKAFVQNRLEKRELKKKQKDLEEKFGTLDSSFEKKLADLKAEYGTPEEARKLWKSGNVYAAFEAFAQWTGVPVATMMKAWHEEIKGKAPTDLKKDIELAEYRRKEAESKAAEDAKKAQNEPEKVVIDDVKVKKAKNWIEHGLAGSGWEKHPKIVEICYDILKENYVKGKFEKPIHALEFYKKQLQELGMGGKNTIPKKGLTAPAKKVTTAPVVNGRKLEGKELFDYVLKTEFNNGKDFAGWGRP